jgi:hypothetical protein
MPIQDPITPSSQNSLNAISQLSNAREERFTADRQQERSIAANLVQQEQSIAANMVTTDMTLKAQMERERLQQAGFDKQRTFEEIEAEKARAFTAAQTKAAFEEAKKGKLDDHSLAMQQMIAQARLQQAINGNSLANVSELDMNQIQRDTGRAWAGVNSDLNFREISRSAALAAATTFFKEGGVNQVKVQQAERFISDLENVMLSSQSQADGYATQARRVAYEAMTGQALTSDYGDKGWIDKQVALFMPKDDFEKLQRQITDPQAPVKLARRVAETTPGLNRNQDGFVNLVGMLQQWRGAIENGTTREATHIKERLRAQVKDLKSKGVSMEEIAGAIDGLSRASSDMAEVYRMAAAQGDGNRPDATSAHNVAKAYASQHSGLINALFYDMDVVDGELIFGYGTYAAGDFMQQFKQDFAAAAEAAGELDISNVEQMFMGDGKLTASERQVLKQVEPFYQAMREETGGMVQELVDSTPDLRDAMEDYFGRTSDFTVDDLIEVQDFINEDLRNISEEVIAVKRDMDEEVANRINEVSSNRTRNYMDELDLLEQQYMIEGQ